MSKEVCPDCGVQDSHDQLVHDEECLLQQEKASLSDQWVKAMHDTSMDSLKDLSQKLADVNTKLEEIQKKNEISALVLTKEALDEIIESKGLKNTTAQEDGRLTKEVSLKIAKKEASNYMPSADEMEKINSISLINLAPEAVMTFEFQAADELVDRGYEHFTPKALKSLAEVAIKNRIPYLTEGDYDHQWRQKNVYGIVYDAFVKSGKLVYKVYIPVIEKTKPVLDAVLTGLYSKLSVGFSMDLNDYVCDSCKKSIFYSECPHFPGMEDEKGQVVTATIKNIKDNFEISGCAVPMQAASHIRRDGEKSVDKELITLGTAFGEGASDAMKAAYIKGISLTEEETEIAAKRLAGAIEAVAPIEIDPEKMSKDLPNLDTINNDMDIDMESAMADENATTTEETVDTSVETVVETKSEDSAPADAANVVDFSAIVEQLVKLNSRVEEALVKLEEANAKLEVAMTASTDTLTKKLEELKAIEKDEVPSPSRKAWVLDRFSVDLGGQK